MRCRACGSEKLIEDPWTGEVVCPRCGLVVSRNSVDPGPEWRALPDERERQKARCQAFALPEYAPLFMGTRNPKLRGMRINVNDGRAEKDMLFNIRRLCEKVGAPSFVERDAFSLYMRARREGVLKDLGYSRRELAMAFVYIAIRRANLPITLRELERVMEEESRREVPFPWPHEEGARPHRGRMVFRVLRALREAGIVGPLPPVPIEALIQRGADALRLPDRVADEARRILRAARRKMAGKKPEVVAAACLELACKRLGVFVLQREIASAFRVTTMALRARRKEIARLLGNDFLAPRPTSGDGEGRQATEEHDVEVWRGRENGCTGHLGGVGGAPKGRRGAYTERGKEA